MEKSEAKLSIEFILNVLRQHEMELDRAIAELEQVTHKVEKLANKVNCVFESLSKKSDYQEPDHHLVKNK